MLRFPDTQTAFVAVRIVKATLAVTLILLSCADRRMRSMRWLALAAVLNIAASELRSFYGPLISPRLELTPGIINESSCLAMMLGLHALSLRVSRIRPLFVGSVLGLTAAAALASPFAPRAALLTVHMLLVVLLAVAGWMAWSPRFPVLQLPLRAIAVVLSGMAALHLVTFAMQATMEHAGIHSASVRLWNTVLMAGLYFLFIAAYVAESSRRLHAETRLDALTGLGNRRALDEVASHEMERAGMTGRPLALLMLDLDRFKTLNDTFGHALGDRALQDFGATLRRVVDRGACIARLGGEEFAVLLPGYSLELAAAVGEMLREAVQQISVAQDDHWMFLSVSIGVSVAHPGETDWRKLLHRSDMALYKAKREGRNRVVLCEEQPMPVAAAAAAETDRNWRRFFSGRAPLL